MKTIPDKPLLLLLLTAYLSFTAFFAENYLFTRLCHEHDHEGGGGTCSVCYNIDLARLLLEGLGRLGAAALLAALIFRAQGHAGQAVSRCREPLSPVKLKVRLNC